MALRKFKWKDCRHPLDTKVACIVDQELFRENIVFVVARNGRLYQYNKVTELWHEHYQSQHLVLSILPGTAMRPSSASLTGSLFMLSEDGGLVEYHWNTWDGWNWVEHGTPGKGVTLVGSPGPCLHGNQLLLIGSDGKVYLRYMDQMTWRWKNCGFPHKAKENSEDETQIGARETTEEVCNDENFEASMDKDADDLNDLESHCDPKVMLVTRRILVMLITYYSCEFNSMQVAATRPIPFSEDSVIFDLRDGRVSNHYHYKRASTLVIHWL